MKRPSRYPAQARAFRPTLEQLENRLVPAVTFQQLDLDLDGAADDVRITGDSQNTKVQILDNGASGVLLAVDANGDGDLLDAGDRPFGSLEFSGNSAVFDLRLGGGDDSVLYSMAGNLAGGRRTIRTDLGDGADHFAFESTNSDIVEQSDLRFDIKAGAGDDEVGIKLRKVTGSNLRVREVLGAGDDESQVRVAGNVDFGSAAHIGVRLGTGDNGLFVGLQGVGFNDVAAAKINVLGGDDPLHRDQVVVEVNDDVGNGNEVSRLAVNASLLAGDDSFLVGLNKKSFKLDDGSRCTVLARGGGGKDGLSVLDGGGPGTLSVDAGAVLGVQLFGDGGADSVFVGFSDDPGRPKALELTGRVRARVDGGDGNDFVGLQMQNTDSSSGHYQLALVAGGGNDHAFFQMERNLGTPAIDPAGKVLLDGGLGADVLENHSPADSKAVLFETIE